MQDLHQIVENYNLNGEIISITPFGHGIINDTFLLKTSEGEYTLQKINKYVFPLVNELMSNIEKVTTHLKKYIDSHNEPYKTLEVIRTKTGELTVQDEEGEFWRIYTYINDVVTLQAVEKPEDFYNAGLAFGHFQKQMADFPADTLIDSIPNFHNTASRYYDFEKAVKLDPIGRVAKVQDEINFIRERNLETHIIVDSLISEAIPLRVTHNDTKLNNVLFDKNTGKPCAVIDLDTVMSGSVLYDFGDSIRYGTNTAAEDEPDTSKVSCDLNLFEQFTRGFLEECGSMLTEKEKDLLPFSAKLITLELAMRFLTDYLLGDRYFKVSRKHHNLDRTRVQLKLVEDMEIKKDKMAEIVNKYR